MYEGGIGGTLHQSRRRHLFCTTLISRGWGAFLRSCWGDRIYDKWKTHACESHTLQFHLPWPCEFHEIGHLFFHRLSIASQGTTTTVPWWRGIMYCTLPPRHPGTYLKSIFLRSRCIVVDARPSLFAVSQAILFICFEHPWYVCPSWISDFYFTFAYPNTTT